MKTCIVCGNKKHIEEFNFKYKVKGIRHSKCKLCQREYSKNHYIINASDYKNRSKISNVNYVKRNREYIRKLKTETPCMDCNTKYPYYVMQFDHLRDKKFSVARISNQSGSLDIIKAEVEKCEIVCANCHAVRTHNRRIRLLTPTQRDSA